MKKIKWFILLIAALFVTGCKDYLLDFSNISVSLDKTNYAINEDIVFSCEGSFAENDFVGSVCIWFDMYKIINGEKIIDTEQLFEINDYGKLKNVYNIENGFRAIISEDECFDQINERIILNILKPGDYEIVVFIRCKVEGAYNEQIQIFNISFTVTE